MQHVNDILSEMHLPRPVKQGKVIPLPTKPVVPPPTRIVDEVMCPRCKNAGFTNSGLAGNKSMLVPCPRCTPRRRSMDAAARQAALVERVFGGPQIPYRAREWSFASFPAEGDHHARALVEQYVAMHKDGSDERSKRGLFIAGKTGRGKTGLAICAIKEFIDAQVLSLFVSVPDVMDRLRAAAFNKDSDENPDELLKVITDIPFLVFDDLGVEKPTPYVLEKFYLIIDKRLSKGLYTVFTSNLSTKDLEAYWRPAGVQEGGFHAGTRIVERIREYCQGVSIRGGNLRDAGW